MKKSVTITKEEWCDEYHEFADEQEDVKQFLMDYFDEMWGTNPEIKIIGKLHDATVTWVCGGYEDAPDCFVVLWWEFDTNDNPFILVEAYAFDKSLQTSVTVA